jgi:peptidoglycan/LPS O-acetylase OafA/YrhL
MLQFGDMRSVVAIIVGYLIFAVSAVMLFQLTAQRPHDEADPSFMVMSVIYGVVFAGLGGYVAGRIAPRRPGLHAAGVGLAIAAGAIASLSTSGPGSASWSQVGAVMFMAPAAVAAGGLVKRKPPTA